MSVSKIVAAAASSAGGDPLDVDDVFSTFLYDGTGASHVITNNIDLSGKGGLVWIKKRNESTNSNHMLFDTVRGTNERLRSDTTDEQYTRTDQLNSFNSNGFTLGGDSPAAPNSSGKEYVSWTFRKAEKFFDVITYSGNSVAGRTISHNLNSDVGMAIIKKTDASSSWVVWHRSESSEYGYLNATDAFTSTGAQNFFGNGSSAVSPTSTQVTLGANSTVNGDGNSYVMYLFAHNNNDGGFGEGEDEDIIKCGSYDSDGTNATISVGFEPQFLMIKNSSGSGDWMVFDEIRGVKNTPYPDLDNTLFWNKTDAERTNTGYIAFTPTGFRHEGGSGDTNTSGSKYIYLAIKRGGMQTPTEASTVFNAQFSTQAINSGTPPPRSGFTTDFQIYINTAYGSAVSSGARMTGDRVLYPSTSGAFADGKFVWDFNDGWGISAASWESSASRRFYQWSRARGFFDVVRYKGSGSASQSIDHNLGVTPEMIWVKDVGNSSNWSIYHSATGLGSVWNFGSGAPGTGNQYWGTAAHTSSVFKVGSDSDTGGSNKEYIAYLFATVAGVSKVGTYTGNAGAQTIDCGFTNGSKFVLIKASNSDWNVWDSVRGIVAGNDPKRTLDTIAAEITDEDFIDPHSSGFTLFNQGDTNSNGITYIFYAVSA